MAPEWSFRSGFLSLFKWEQGALKFSDSTRVPGAEGLTWDWYVWCEIAGAVLLHSIWQGVIVALMLGLLLRRLPASRAKSRYVAGSLALISIVMLALVTAAWASDRWQAPSQFNGSSLTSQTRLTNQFPSINLSSATRETPLSQGTPLNVMPDSDRRRSVADRQSGDFVLLRNWPVWLTAGWLLGATFMLVRLACCLVGTHRVLREEHRPDWAILEDLEKLIDELARQLGVWQTISLVCSSRVMSPCIGGLLWPVLLMPTSLINGVPLDVWRVILAHELAHVRRWDYLINLFQMLVESVFFYHPAVWWISRRMRVEREACCDALAAECTGRPLAVARALLDVADWAEQRRITHARAIMAWQSFDGDGDPNELSDRVHRLAQPDAAPRLRLPWYTFLGVLAFTVTCLFVLQWGARVAVQTAVKSMTPAERVEKLVEINLSQFGSARAETSGGAVSQGATPAIPDVHTTLTGVIKTNDGTELPRDLYVHLQESTKNSMRSATVSVDLKNPLQGVFSTQIRTPCSVAIYSTAMGRAPAIFGPLRARPGMVIPPVELVLSRGQKLAIRILDERGKPLAGVAVSGNLLIEFGSGKSSVRGFPDLRSDVDGMINIENGIPNREYQVVAEKSGIQKTRETLLLKSGQVIDWTLKDARPTTGLILSEETGKPVENAEIVFVNSQCNVAGKAFNEGIYDPREAYTSGRLVAVSGSDGSFSLDTLADDSEYALCIKSANYRWQILEHVSAGEKDLIVKMKPPLYVKGRIDGPLDSLSKVQQDGKTVYQIRYTNPIRLDNFSHYGGGWVSVTTLDGVSTYTIPTLFPGELTITAGKTTRTVNVEKSIDNLDIVLDSPVEPANSVAKIKNRKVIFELTGLPPDLPVKGSLHLNCSSGGDSDREMLVDFRNQRAVIELPQVSTVSYSAEKAIGCWFKREYGVAIPAGADPLVISIPALPAGAIAGNIINPDGTPCTEFSLKVIVSKKPKGLGTTTDIDESIEPDPSGTFLINSLPLDGTYRIRVSVDDPSGRVLLSPPLRLDAQSPIQKTTIRFPNPTPLSVTVQDDFGKPVPGRTVQLKYTVSGDDTSYGASFSLATDRSGVVVFPGWSLSPDVTYELSVSPSEKLMGAVVERITSSRPIQVQLRAGKSLQMVLVESGTGRRIPRAAVRFHPKNFNLAKYKDAIFANTDSKGELLIQNLEDLEYRVYVDGADAPGRVYTKHPTGGYSISGSGEMPTIVPGSGTTIRVPVSLTPNSRLKTIDDTQP